jgi:hypothetical protein
VLCRPKKTGLKKYIYIQQQRKEGKNAIRGRKGRGAVKFAINKGIDDMLQRSQCYQYKRTPPNCLMLHSFIHENKAI